MRLPRTRQPLSIWVWLLAAAKIAIHLFDDPAYGYFRDELYYIACSDHLAWGYVDHPPLSIAILAVVRALFGDSMLAIRVPVVLAGAATVVVTGLVARDLGGGRFAQALAAFACLIMGYGLGISTFFSMNAFENLFWIAAVFVVVRCINSGDERWWIAFGLLSGFGLLNKISMSFIAFGILVGIALSQRRAQLLSPWLWLGGALSAVIFLPHIWWQMANGWPTLEFMRNATNLKIRTMPLGEYLAAQIIYTNPATLPIWLGGLVYFLFARTGKTYRLFGIAYIAILVLLVAQGAKAYYLAPAYPMLMAAGAVGLEAATAARARRWIRPLLISLMVVIGGGAVPMAVPILPPATTLEYAHAIGLDAPREERSQTAALSQHLADRFGWEHLVAVVAQAYAKLPDNERTGAVAFARNYGEAGAIDFFGPRYGLPPAISGHNNYWLWGPGAATGDIVISVGIPRERLEQLFDEVTQVDTIVSPYASSYEANLPVYVCRRLKQPLKELWPELKGFV